MRTVLPIKLFEPFTMEVIDAMDWAFKATLMMVENGEPLLRDEDREVIALRIVESAQRGMSDRRSLCEDAVEHWRAQRSAA
ncbi:MAG: hypothetical protein AB7O60_03690 [Variibacter sp.]